MKKIKVYLSLFLIGTMTISSLLFTGCGKSAKNGELNLFVWTEYIPDDVIEKFEEEYDIKVNVTTYSSNEDMLNKIKSESEGTYDICVPTDYMVEQMINQDLLEEIDTSGLKNYSNLGIAYLDQDFDPGNKHSVPYMGGVATIAVNTSKVTDEITSYNDLFNEKYKDSIVVLDDFRAVIGLAAKSLGYSMSETDPAKLSEIQDKLLTLKDNIKVYDSDNPKSLLISGEVSLAYIWNAEIALAIKENPDIKIVFPEEGAYLFLDNFCIPKGAKNSENAQKFIDFMLEGENSKMVSETFPYLNPNEAAVKLLGSEYQNNQASNIPAKVFQNGEYIHDVGEEISTYDKMWTELTK